MTDNRFTVSVGLMVAALAAVSAPTFAATFNDLPSFQAATQSLTLIDFDTDPAGNSTVQGTEIGSTYTTLGVDFPTGNKFGGLAGPVSPPTGWLNNTVVGSDRVFDATFNVGGITAVGVYNALYGGIPNGSRLDAWDASNSPLGSVLSDSNDARDFFGLTTTSAIDHITVTVMSPSGWGLDNLYFGQVVPLPGAFVPGVIGLALVGWIRRRSR